MSEDFYFSNKEVQAAATKQGAAKPKPDTLSDQAAALLELARADAESGPPKGCEIG